jgi:hypothetical protein
MQSISEEQGEKMSTKTEIKTNIRIKISVPVHPTESKEKVEKALKNVFPSVEFILSEEHYIGKSQDIQSLDHFKALLTHQRIRDTANTMLRRSRRDGELVFYLNKQAAFMGKVNFSEECPLGPITVTVKGKDIDQVIDHLSPRTAEQ